MATAHWTVAGWYAVAAAALVLLAWTAALRAHRRQLEAREDEIDDRTDQVARAQHELYLERKRVERERQAWQSMARDPEHARLGQQIDVLRAELAGRIELLGILRDREPEVLRRAERDLALRRGHWRRLATRETLILHSMPPGGESIPPA
jgi:hypothetical protein